MKKKLLLLCIIPILYGCPTPCPNVEKVTIGPLTAENLALCPYQTDSTYRFRHTNGFVVNFTAKRETTTELGGGGWDYGCGPSIQYDANRTILTPDYPILEMRVEITNRDSTQTSCTVNIGRAYFYVYNKKTTDNSSYFSDSLIISNKKHYNVQRLKNLEYSYNNDTTTDSIYYNFTSGIIKIILKNGESYTKID